MSEMKHTPGPWEAKQVRGWGNDPVIVAPGWPKPIATMVAHPDRYYTHVQREIRGETVTTFSKPTDEGEARKSEVDNELLANAAFIVTACNSHYDNLATIAALKAENERLREALEPFSRMAGLLFSANKNANEPLYGFGKQDEITVIYVGDFFKARAALTKQEG